MPREARTLRPDAPTAVLFVTAGRCRVSGLEREQREAVDVSGGARKIATGQSEAEVVVVSGDWGEETGSRGVFTLEASHAPRNAGDPADYPRNTDFDRHYHDCDEYWIILAGRGRVVTEGESFDVGPGDCVATPMGRHHDFPLVFETVRGVWFETTLSGKKRIGHLWEHTHGPAEGRVAVG